MPATSNPANGRTTIRIVSGNDRPLREVKELRELPGLIDTTEHSLPVDDCPSEQAFIDALQKESDVTIITCHGAPREDGCHLSWRNAEIAPGQVPRIGARNGIILNVCNVLAPEVDGRRGWDKQQVSRIAGGRALTGGIGIVKETHLQWFVEALLEELDASPYCLSTAEKTLTTFTRVHRTLAARRGNRGADRWEDLWHEPYSPKPP